LRRGSLETRSQDRIAHLWFFEMRR
jgi:hypothetical protein